MEEKKKRFRPTLTEYRALQNDLSVAKEQLRLQLLADDYLSQKYNILEKTYKALKVERDTLTTSNNLMEGELIRLRKELEIQHTKHRKLRKAREALKNRSFLQRLFNL